MSKISHVEFRTPCDPPTEPGWYWCKCGEEIVPKETITMVNFRDNDKETIYTLDEEGDWNYKIVNNLSWFGPVTMVKESKIK